MVGVVKSVGGGLVDRHRPGTGHGIRFLSGMDRQGFRTSKERSLSLTKIASSGIKKPLPDERRGFVHTQNRPFSYLSAASEALQELAPSGIE